MSGGIQRDWAGVPRQLYLKETKSHRCACIREEGPPTQSAIEYADDDEGDAIGTGPVEHKPRPDNGDLSNPRLREYPDCEPLASECTVNI